MHFLGSILFGVPGQYDLGDTRVIFTNEDKEIYTFSSALGNHLVGRSADAIMQNRVFQLLSFSYLHVFVHEMGHALAYGLLTGKSADIEVYTRAGAGVTTPIDASAKELDCFERTIFSLAGPLTDMLFSSAQLVGGVYCWRHGSAPLGGVIGVGGATWIFGELLYAAVSGASGDSGDFGQIRDQGFLPFTTSSALLLAAAGLGVFGSLRILA